MTIQIYAWFLSIFNNREFKCVHPGHSIEVDKFSIAEKYFHDKYKKCNYHNEWFTFSETEVCEVVELMTSYQTGKQKQEGNQNRDEKPVLEIDNQNFQPEEQSQDRNLEIKRENLVLPWIKKILMFFFYVLIIPPITVLEFIKVLFRLRGFIPKLLLWIKKILVFAFYALFFPPMLVIEVIKGLFKMWRVRTKKSSFLI